jgi:hypothetical protein
MFHNDASGCYNHIVVALATIMALCLGICHRTACMHASDGSGLNGILHPDNAWLLMLPFGCLSITDFLVQDKAVVDPH